MSEATPAIPQVPPSKEPEIHVIPEKFYGAALKAKVEEKKTAPVAAMPAPPKRSWIPIALVATVLVLGVSGGFVYMNRGLLFAPGSPTVNVETPAPPPPPSAPGNASATSSNPQSAIVSWTDTSDNESGFRIERGEGSADFLPLTNLPPNSTSFLDASVDSGRTYNYRVIALNVSGASDPSNVATAAVPVAPPPPPERPTLPPAGLDSDSDGITDLEESLYGTASRNPDSDNDGFLDGNEVFHLYNPAGSAPVRLLDSALVKIVTAPAGWVMSVPTSWNAAMNAQDGSRATIDSRHGEVFRISIEDNPQKRPILDWYLEAHPEVNASQVLQYRSKGGYSGVIGPDQLTTYIPWGDRVFVFAYDLDDQPFINYRTTYSMMLNSLILSGMPQVAPPQPGDPLPFEPSATSSGVVTQPVPVDESAATTSAP